LYDTSSSSSAARLLVTAADDVAVRSTILFCQRATRECSGTLALLNVGSDRNLAAVEEVADAPPMTAR
jgi:hypothetical protein